MKYPDLIKKLQISRVDLGFLGLVLLYVLIGYAIAAAFDALHFYSPFKYVSTAIDFTKVLLLAYIVFWGGWVFYTMITKRPKDLKGYLWADLQQNALNKDRYIRALPVFIGCIFMLSTFTSLKTMIPFVNPFEWDTTFADWDAALHGGTDVWRLWQPLLGYPPVTFIINVVYNFWLAVMYVMLYWLLLSKKDPHTRMQFFYSVLFCFAVNGSFLAMLLSSAGPCYYDYVLGIDRFAPLMEYLQSIGGENYKLWALRNQDYLLNEYETDAHGVGAGISAMPSVHVSFALICMMIGLRKNRFWKFMGIGFLAFILIGSVHLGWHYAIDGYVAILTTLPMWFTAGWLVTKLSRD